MCNVLEVSQSGYYRWKRENRFEKRKGDTFLTIKVEELFEQSRKTYGTRRLRRELKNEGIMIKDKRLSRLMKERGLKVITKRKFKVTTNSGHKKPVAENLLKDGIKSDGPNKVWVGDITYIWTREGWLYLASVLEVWSRKIIGWCLSNRIDKEIVIGAMKMALNARNAAPGLIFHSDRGSQYASNEFRTLLGGHDIIQSMSGKGKCYDNAMKESFFHTLKTELVYQQTYNTRKEAELSIFEYIEVFYNRKRMHSSIGYVSPDFFEVANVK